MKFAIITHAVHKLVHKKIFAYEPYVREMNLWAKHVNEIKIISPVSLDKISKIEESYVHNRISIVKIPSFNILNFKNKLKSILLIPIILIRIFKTMYWAEHIHLRCPSNIGLLACFLQIFFPNKPKTVKYAGNWDPNSKQPLSYKLQKVIISNTYFTRNCKVLVYGKWKNQTKNIVPFFTASYTKNEVENIPEKKLESVLKFIFVGAFSEGKQPMLSVKTIERLLSQGYDVQLDMFGNGAKFNYVKNYILEKKLSNRIILHGNQSKETVKNAYKKSHFLIFISKSEGWPKVVAEAMFWRCLPISSKVSCVEYMLDYGKRGSTVSPYVNSEEIADIIKYYINNEESYQIKAREGQIWSQKIILDTFEKEIMKFL